MDRQAMKREEKLCVKGVYFQDNVVTAFEFLRKDTDFTDVTLVCEDGHQVGAHKVVLVASSPFFRNMLKRNNHTHPLIYMRGLKSEDLVAIIDFLYYGEANIYQENLQMFLNIAKELELKGLSEELRRESDNMKKLLKETMRNKPDEQPPMKDIKEPPHEEFITEFEFEEQPKTDETLSKYDFSGDMQELDKKLESMMAPGKNVISNGPNRRSFMATLCLVCGKEDTRSHMKGHIEANHLKGLFFPCCLCEKVFNTRGALKQHRKIKDH